MEVEKRKREDDGGSSAKRRKNNDGAEETTSVPPDEEVEEFFAILKRIHVAVKYFQERDAGGRDLTAPPWTLTFEREDFDGVKMTSEGKQSMGLDLNSDPVSDVSDHGD